MKNIILLAFIFSSIISFAQINSYIRKGNRAVERNKLEKAKSNFLKAYNLDKTNYDANLGMGFVLSEFMNKYEEALPYLETAISKSQKDTFPDLIFPSTSVLTTDPVKIPDPGVIKLSCPIFSSNVIFAMSALMNASIFLSCAATCIAKNASTNSRFIFFI